MNYSLNSFKEAMILIIWGSIIRLNKGSTIQFRVKLTYITNIILTRSHMIIVQDIRL